MNPLLRRTALLSCIGLALGLGGARLVNPLVGSLLIGVSPNDPVGFAAVSLVLASIALGATWLPAWYASAVNPVSAFRDE